MTTTALPTTTPTSTQPTGTARSPESGAPRRHRGRGTTIVLVAGGAVVAVAAVGTGIVLGGRATTPTAPTVGTTVTFPSDWQLYRAGERGDVLGAPLPGDLTTYRAGERTTTSSSGHASDWSTYRAGER